MIYFLYLALFIIVGICILWEEKDFEIMILKGLMILLFLIPWSFFGVLGSEIWIKTVDPEVLQEKFELKRVSNGIPLIINNNNYYVFSIDGSTFEEVEKRFVEIIPTTSYTHIVKNYNYYSHWATPFSHKGSYLNGIKLYLNTDDEVEENETISSEGS